MVHHFAGFKTPSSLVALNALVHKPTPKQFLCQLFLYCDINTEGGDAMRTDKWLKREVRIFQDCYKKGR
jgi:hypothetical protein